MAQVEEVLSLLTTILNLLIIVMVMNAFGLKGVIVYGLINFLSNSIVHVHQGNKHILAIPELLDLQSYYRNGKFRIPGWEAGGSAFINIEVLVKNILLALIFIAFMMKSNIVSVENMNPMNLMNVDYNLANAL